MTCREAKPLLGAYLDGELGGEAARLLEAKLSLNPEARAEAETLRRTWEMLDYLPRPEPSPSFTHKTLERLAPLRAAQAAGGWRRWRNPVFGLGWAAALVLASLGGYGGFNHFAPHHPDEQDLIRDLRIIENKRLYDLADDLQFLEALDHPDLFGDETSGS